LDYNGLKTEVHASTRTNRVGSKAIEQIPICLGLHLYAIRNHVERSINGTMQCCRIITLYEKPAANFLSMI